MHNPQPGNGLAHSGSHALHLSSSLQVPGIADGPDEAGGVRTVGYNASASLKGIEDTQDTLAAETTGAEAPKPCTHAEATNVKRHTSHLHMQESSRVGGVDPDSPKPFPTPTDYPVTHLIDQAPVSTAACTVTHDAPYFEAISIPFAATLGPAHLESTKRIPLTVSDTPDPPSTHAKANSPTEGSAFVHSSTAEDRCATSGHVSSIDGGTLPRLSQWQEAALLSTTEHDHVAAMHGSTEAFWPCHLVSHAFGDFESHPVPFPSYRTATVFTHDHRHHPQPGHINVPHHLTCWDIKKGLHPPVYYPVNDTAADALAPSPAKEEHFTASPGLRAK